MTEGQEIALGAQSDPQIVAVYGLYNDTEIQTFIQQKGKAMAAISHRPDLNYEFKVLDSPVINAFAVPGGYVYFTRGILAHFNNEAEFAGVLGHEIGHITARHSAKQQSNAQLAQVLFIGGMIASESFRNFAQPINQGMGLLFLKFGRDDESQSDKLGAEYSTKIGYDAHQMANFFGTLKKMREQSGQSKFQFPVPNGWQTQNLPSVVQMAPEANDAMMTMTLAANGNLRDIASKFVNDNNLSVVEQSSTSVNGYEAYALITSSNSKAELDLKTGFGIL